MQKADKFDTQKLPLELVDPYAIEGLAKVLQFGAQKYAPNNWRGGLSYTRLIGAIKRHLAEIEKGNDIDDESGLPHVDHLGCEWMFLSYFMKFRGDLDDRYKEKTSFNQSDAIHLLFESARKATEGMQGSVGEVR